MRRAVTLTCDGCNAAVSVAVAAKGARGELPPGWTSGFFAADLVTGRLRRVTCFARGRRRRDLCASCTSGQAGQQRLPLIDKELMQ